MRRGVVGVGALAVLVAVAGTAWAKVTVTEAEENVVASRLPGKWQPHEDLNARLAGTRSGFPTFEFRSAPAVAERMPDRFQELAGGPIYMAGTLTVAGKDERQDLRSS